MHMNLRLETSGLEGDILRPDFVIFYMDRGPFVGEIRSSSQGENTKPGAILEQKLLKIIKLNGDLDANGKLFPLRKIVPTIDRLLDSIFQKIAN